MEGVQDVKELQRLLREAEDHAAEEHADVKKSNAYEKKTNDYSEKLRIVPQRSNADEKRSNADEKMPKNLQGRRSHKLFRNTSRLAIYSISLLR